MSRCSSTPLRREYSASTRRILCWLFAVACVVSSSLSFSVARVLAEPTTSDALLQANYHWHLAGVAEAHRDNIVARNEYKLVITSAASCERHIREWFIGAAQLAIARCDARDHNQPGVECALDSALVHHFWTLEMIRIEPVIGSTVDKHWLDSTLDHWTTIRDSHSGKWKPQSTIMIYPTHAQPGSKLPLIVALHGGTSSYREFAEHWRAVADTLNVAVAVPAGPVRMACGVNSWGEDFETIDSIVETTIRLSVADPRVDSSQVFLAGFSQGAEAALKIALVHPDEIKGAVLFSGYIDSEIPSDVFDRAAQAGVKIYALSGALEPASLVRSLENTMQQARQLGLRMELHRLADSGHEVPLDLTHQMNYIWSWMH